MHEDQLAVVCRQSVIHDNVDPVTLVPETEFEHSAVVGPRERLLRHNDAVEEMRVAC